MSELKILKTPLAIASIAIGTWLLAAKLVTGLGDIDVQPLDIGVVAPGTVTTQLLPVRNSGNADLDITNVGTSCGCTVPREFPRHLPAGATVLIPLSVTAPRGKQPLSVTVNLETKNARRQIYKAALSGEVSAEVAVSPGRIDLGSVDAGTRSREVLAAEFERDGIGPNSVISTAAYLHPSIRNADGKRASVDLSIDPAAPRGEFHEYLMIRNNSGAVPYIVVPIAGQIARGIRFAPAEAFFGLVDRPQEYTQQICLTPISHTWDAPRVILPKNAPFLAAELRGTAPGLMLHVTINAAKMPSRYEGAIELHDAKSQDTLAIPVRAIRTFN